MEYAQGSNEDLLLQDEMVMEKTDGRDRVCHNIMVYIGVFSCLGGLVMLFGFGVRLVSPYALTSEYGEQAVLCTVVESELDFNTTVDCYCGEECETAYPCLRVYVRYNTTESKGVPSAFAFVNKESILWSEQREEEVSYIIFMLLSNHIFVTSMMA